MDPLADVIRRGMAELGIPGVAAAVIEGDDVRTIAEGVTSLEHPQPVTAATLFQIGSISKTFVATAAMALVVDGRLDLDAPVVQHVDDLRLSSPELTEGVTMRHLLTHTSGWVGDYFGDTGEGDDALARFVAKLAKAPQVTPLGWAYSYNNSAFNLASHVVALVHGTSYERAVKELILRPLEMRRTTFSAQDAITERVAIGHRDGVGQRWRRPRAHHGAGGVLSCVDDLVRYARFHLDTTDRPELAAMQEAQRPAGSLCDEVGLSWMLDTHHGTRLVHHGGTTNGYQADLRLAPDRGLAWVLLTNAEHHHQLDRLVREHLLGVEPAPAAFAPDDLDEYAGRYESVLAELDVVVGAGGGLRLDVGTPRRALWNPDDEVPAPSPTRLVFRDADRVQALDHPYTGHRGEFVRDDDGAVGWLRWDGRLAVRRAGPTG